MRQKKLSAWFLTLALVLSLVTVPVAAAGNWYDEALNTWVERGVVKGDANGNLNPTSNITRAEMAVMLERIMGYRMRAQNTFHDVQEGAWYTDAMLAANAAGIVKGADGLARPGDKITRQEATVMLARVMDMSSGTNVSFNDQDAVANWATDSVSAMAGAGYIQGSNGMFRPADPITRAEAMTILNNMFTGYYNQAGAYTAETTGSAVINVGEVTLSGNVGGDLIIAEGVGDGHIVLDNFNLGGRLIVRGGGENSIIITGTSNVPTVLVARQEGKVRVSVEGSAQAANVTVANGSNSVKVEGTVTNVTVAAASVNVEITGTVKTVTMSETAQAASLVVSKDAKVDNVTTAASESKVSVVGTVATVTASAPQSEIAVTGTVTTVETTVDATGSAVTVGKDAKVETVSAAAPRTEISVSGTVSKVETAPTASGSTVDTAKGAKVDTVVTNAPNTTIQGDKGTVGKVEVGKDAGNTTVNAGGAKVENNSSDPVSSGSGTIKPGESGTSAEKPADKPSTGGGSSSNDDDNDSGSSGGGGGGNTGGNTNPPTPTVPASTATFGVVPTDDQIELLGKKSADLGAHFAVDGLKVTGGVKLVEQYTGWWNDANEYNGYFIPLVIKPGEITDNLTIKVAGKTFGKSDLETAAPYNGKLIFIYRLAKVVAASAPGVTTAETQAERAVTLPTSLDITVNSGSGYSAKTYTLDLSGLVTFDDAAQLWGAGTEAAPYQIHNETDLENMAKLSTAMSQKGGAKHFKLMADITLTETTLPGGQTSADWKPFCENFQGVFDGQGHTLTANDAVIRYLFRSTVGNATIKNLNVVQKATFITLVAEVNKYQANQGVVLLENIAASSASETVMQATNNDSTFVNFVFNTSGTGTFTMRNCVNNANINMTSYAGVFVGGYLGNNSPATAVAGKVTFENCTNTGTITGVNVGLFSGNNCTPTPTTEGLIEVTNCKNTGKMTGTKTCTLFATNNGAYKSDWESLNNKYVAVSAEDLMTLKNMEGLGLSNEASGLKVTMTGTETDIANYKVMLRVQIYFTRTGGSSAGSSYVELSETVTVSGKQTTVPKITSAALSALEADFSSVNDREKYMNARYTLTNGVWTICQADLVEKMSNGATAATISSNHVYTVIALDSKGATIGSATLAASAIQGGTADGPANSTPTQDEPVASEPTDNVAKDMSDTTAAEGSENTTPTEDTTTENTTPLEGDDTTENTDTTPTE